jgi:hypothetical protein
MHVREVLAHQMRHSTRLTWGNVLAPAVPVIPFWTGLHRIHIVGVFTPFRLPGWLGSVRPGLAGGLGAGGLLGCALGMLWM